MKRCISCVLALLLLLPLFACGRETSGPEEELAFPGTYWGMPPEELIQALDLEEGAYETEEEPYDPAAGTSGTFAVGVDGVEVFNSLGNVAFQFSDDTGAGGYGLACVIVYYPEGMEFQTVKSAMSALYGEPTRGREDMGLDEEDPDGHITGWTSEAVQADVMSREVLDSLPEEAAALSRERSLTSVVLSDGTVDSGDWPAVLGAGIMFYSALPSLRSLQKESGPAAA